MDYRVLESHGCTALTVEIISANDTVIWNSEAY